MDSANIESYRGFRANSRMICVDEVEIDTDINLSSANRSTADLSSASLSSVKLNRSAIIQGSCC